MRRNIALIFSSGLEERHTLKSPACAHTRADNAGMQAGGRNILVKKSCEQVNRGYILCRQICCSVAALHQYVCFLNHPAIHVAVIHHGLDSVG